ncbi:MAG: efflux transporter outer membrane subunit [Planctomycetaceae bacterium]|nr:efflux transporter outer membrane subunit [Planctomycetaceae bacterium]
MKWYFNSGGLLGALLIGGCMVGPNYVPPQPKVPDAWQKAAAAGQEPNALRQWWTVFDDPALTALIERSAYSNYDIQAALSRIVESRALRNAAAGQFYPNVDATGFYSRNKQSQNAAAPGFGSFVSTPYDLYSVGFDASWEIDLFGGIRRSIQSAQAALEASVADYYNVRTSLLAEVGRNYIELRASQQRIRYAQANINIQRQTLELTQGRFDAQLAPRLDVTQSELNLANTESEIPLLRIAEEAAFNRLSVLVGEMPQDLQDRLRQTAPLPELPDGVISGIPADIMRRRPDIRRAERALAAQSERIGVAVSQLYPRFSLTGSFALQSRDFSDLGDVSKSKAYSFGPGFGWSVFNAGQLRSLVQAEEARTAQLLASYESAVLLAVEEVENAMVGFVQQGERLNSLERSVSAAEESVQLSETLYRSGLTDFENVLLDQRALAVQQDRLAVSRGDVLQQAISLYKALGGGWDWPAENETIESRSAQAEPERP